MKYVGFDLDGTLAHHAAGDSTDVVGMPIPEMVAVARKYIADGVPVRIITARVAPEYSDADEQRAMITVWAERHLGQPVVVQSHKCGRMDRLYDDRAIGVVRNTGVLSTDRAYAEGVDAAYREMEAGDQRPGAEIEAVALFKPEWLERDDLCSNPIMVSPMTGNSDDDFFVSVAGAEALVSQLLRSIRAARKAIGEPPAGELDQGAA